MIASINVTAKTVRSVIALTEIVSAPSGTKVDIANTNVTNSGTVSSVSRNAIV